MDRGDKKSLIKFNYELFAHHIYELEKGLRHLVLHTAPADTLGYMVKKLEKNSISFFIEISNFSLLKSLLLGLVFNFIILVINFQFVNSPIL